MGDLLRDRYKTVCALKDEAMKTYAQVTIDPSSLIQGTLQYSRREAAKLTLDNYVEEEKRLFVVICASCST